MSAGVRRYSGADKPRVRAIAVVKGGVVLICFSGVVEHEKKQGRRLEYIDYGKGREEAGHEDVPKTLCP